MTTTTTAAVKLSYLGTLLKQAGRPLRVQPAIARPIVDVARDAKAATTATAWASYEAALALAQATRRAALASAQATYEAAEALAWASYEAATAPAQATRRAALARLEKQ